MDTNRNPAPLFMAQSNMLGGSLNVDRRNYRVTGQALETLLIRAEITRVQLEEQLGFEPGTITLMINGHTRGLIAPHHWFSVLAAIGMKEAETFMGGIEGFDAAFPRLLGAFVTVWAFKNELRFEKIMERLSLQWKDIPGLMREWQQNVFTANGVRLLKACLNIDVYRNENGEAFCDMMNDYQLITGDDAPEFDDIFLEEQSE